jgi:hypothetical protein
MRRLLFVLLLPALLPAQKTSCGLSGVVQDPAGSVIAAIRVTLTSEGNGFVRTATTTNEGFFNFPDLTPATFTLSIDAAGFKAYRQIGIAIGSGEQRSLGQIKLQIGQVSETVSVTAELVSVNTTTAEKGGTLTGDQLDQIALRGRDLFDAISLLPGVVDTSDGRDAPGPTSIGNIYIMGGRNDAKNMTVDGVSNLDTGSNGSVHSMPSIDSVAEVKVLMSAYSAENGRNPASISVITRGGQKDFHGSAGFYLRNEALNANDFFANVAGRPRTEYRYNIGSYSIGGPVILPKVNRSHEKLFFFFNQEFQRQVQQYGVKTVTVPTALERQGDFSKSYNTNGSPINVNDPLDGKRLFPGKVIPASRNTQVGRNILNIFPLPNYVDPNPTRVYQWNYYASDSGLYPRRTETARIDYSPKDNWQLYVSVSNNADKQNTPYGVWVDGSLNFPLVPIVFEQPGRLATIHSTNTLSPSTFNELTVAGSQNTLRFYPLDNSKLDRTKLGILIPQRNPSLNPLNIIPNMTFGGIQNAANPSINDGTPYFNQNTIYHLTDNVSKVWETHTFKAGIYHERTLKFQSASSATRGTVSFSNDGNNVLDSNNAYANALLGNYDTYAEATARPQGKYFFTNFEFYVQDNWKVKSNLNLDYGVRFYHDPPQYDIRHQLASFSLAAYSVKNSTVLLRPATVNGTKVALNPVTGATYPQGLIGAFAPGIGDPANGSLVGGNNGVPEGFYTTLPIAVAPRFGLAWDPTRRHRTSVRLGGGVYFDRIQGNPIMGTINNPPTIYTPTQYYGSFADIIATVNAGVLAPNGSITSLSTKGHQQTYYNFSFSIDQQIGRSELIELGYTGSLGRHLLWQRNLNPVPLGSTTAISGALLHPENRDPTGGATTTLPVNFMRPLQGLGDVLSYEFATASNYHALTARYVHRFTHGVNASASYTFSKALDTVDSYSNQVDAFVDPRSRNYGPAGFDRNHVFSANFFWNLPRTRSGIRPVRWVGDDWVLSGVVRMMTGGKFTPSYSLLNSLPNPTGSSSETARPQVLDPNAPIETRFGPAPQPTAANPKPQIGNLGKNTFVGPGVNNWDLSLYKNLKFTEHVRGQLRFESYNTFNHTQFSAVDTTLRFDSAGKFANPLFNQPTSARPARRIQLAARITF